MRRSRQVRSAGPASRPDAAHDAWRLTLVRLIAVLAVGALAILAAAAGSRLPGGSAWTVTVDVTVGIAFVFAAASAPGQVWMRALVAGVGVSWLVGSLVPEARLAHQGLLAIGLIVFPGTWPAGVLPRFLAVAAVPVGLGMVSQLGAAALFAGIAATAVVTRSERTSPAAWYATSSALGVAAVLAWWSISAQIDPDAFDPAVGLLMYEVTLTAIAVGFAFAARAVIAARARMTDLVLGDGSSGLGGLATVMSGVLGDPELRVHRWPSGESAKQGGDDLRRIDVWDGTTPVAVVEHNSSVLEDPSMAEAVAVAVRLAVRHLELEEDLQARLDELESARARLLAASDRQRETTATRLREDVVPLLRRATEVLDRALPVTGDQGAEEALAVAVVELTAAEDDVLALVAGVPPVELGEGRLHDAIAAVAERSPVPVTVTVATGATGDVDKETALFYVCTEAVTNAVKHAGGTRIDVTLGMQDGALVLAVSDDGRGGADVSGWGLQGLADRLAAHRGGLRVDSPPGAGTVVTATVPISRSSPTV